MEMARERGERRMLVARGAVLMVENREAYSLMAGTAGHRRLLLEEVGFNMRRLIADFSVEAGNAALHNTRLQSKLKTLLSELDVSVAVMQAKGGTNKGAEREDRPSARRAHETECGESDEASDGSAE